MGRVVKGAHVGDKTYQLKAREPIPVPGLSSFDDPVEAVDGPDVPVAVDMDAARAEAAKLVEDAGADAERLLEDARERSLELLDDAQARVGQIETDARAKGFEEGTADGRAAAQAEMDEMLETMRGLIEMARLERHKIIQGAEPEIVKLAVSISERILNAHIDLQPGAVLEMARSAITRLVGRETVTVRVHPSDLELMRENRDRLMSLNDIDNLRLIADQRVDRGGVVIDTESGTIDAKISTQLREVRRLLAVEEPLSVAPSPEPPLLNAPAQAS